MANKTQSAIAPPASRSAHPMAMIAPEALPISVAVATYGMSRSCLYRLASEGRIKIVKNGRQSLVLAADLRAYLASLPPAQIRRGTKSAA
jgi:predicted DNA-binding transcriptional regulator AlpA